MSVKLKPKTSKLLQQFRRADAGSIKGDYTRKAQSNTLKAMRRTWGKKRALEYIRKQTG